MGIIEDSEKYVLNTYTRYPVIFDHGEGVWLYTPDNKKYLDMSAGIAVSSLGHNHPKLVENVVRQVKKLIHTSNLYYTQPYTSLAKKLIEISKFSKVFFCNSGAEANEAAIKLARKYGKRKGNNKKYKILTMKNSFHGRTIATISATGQTKFQKGFEPLLEGFSYIEFNNVKDLENNFDKNTCAVIIEPTQGEGGIYNSTVEFLRSARRLCDKYDALLIFDEVQTGVGRTGKFFGYQNYLPTKPDVITLAKGLAGGMPIGAMIVNEKAKGYLTSGEHASTFGGNPVSCSAALAVVEIVNNKEMLQKINDIGVYFREKLIRLQQKYSFIVEVRGVGLLNGIEIDFPTKELVNELFKAKILSVPAGNNVVRFLPPLVVEKEHCDIVINELENIFSKRNSS